MHTNTHVEPKRRRSRLLLTVGLIAGAVGISTLGSPAEAAGAERVSVEGVGVPSACNPEAPLSTTMTGDLDGCLSIFPEKGRCIESPDGTAPDRYIEHGMETFDGTVKAGSVERTGTFETSYVFKATFEAGSGCDFAKQLAGGCVHPIVPGSGTGGLSDLKTGKLTFVDRIENAPNWASDFPFTGFLVFND